MVPGYGRLDLSTIRSLYHRRPSVHSFPHLSEQDAAFAAAQARHGFGGVLTALDCLYVNHPRLAAAEYKPVGLAAAALCGLRVPATLITSCPDSARRFVAKQPTIYKPLWLLPYASAEGVPLTIPTSRVVPEEIDEGVAGTAHLFQAEVPKIADVRVTVIGDQIFPVRIDSEVLDWRCAYDRLRYSVIDLPPAVVAGISRYLHHFGLVYGAFDFALDEHGGWWFLECNPSGQFAWMEPETGLPLTRALADLLERGTR